LLDEISPLSWLVESWLVDWQLHTLGCSACTSLHCNILYYHTMDRVHIRLGAPPPMAGVQSSSLWHKHAEHTSTVMYSKSHQRLSQQYNTQVCRCIIVITMRRLCC
jgi:hypothetical protein